LFPCASCGSCKNGSTFSKRVCPACASCSSFLNNFSVCNRRKLGSRCRLAWLLFLNPQTKVQSVTYSRISVTTPAPTVLPPSRMANRSSFSRATGVINSTVICTLSPGMIISAPSGRFSEPVTSVVRK